MKFFKENPFVAPTVVALLIGLFLGYLFGIQSKLPAQTAVDSVKQNTTVSMMLDFGDGTVKTFRSIAPSQKTSILTLTQDIARANNINFKVQDYKGLGTLVTEIGKGKNGTGNKYWQYWVNNVSVQTGAAEYLVHPGDVIEWKFIPYASK